MKFLNSKPAIIVAGVLTAGLVFFLISRQAGAAVADLAASAGDAVAPTNNDNIFAGAVDAVGDALDDGDGGNDSFSLGSFIFDVFNPAFDPNDTRTADRDSLDLHRSNGGPI